MPKETEATTILSGVIGIPVIRVVRNPRSVIAELEPQITGNGMQQARAGRLPDGELEQLQLIQRAQRRAALERK